MNWVELYKKTEKKTLRRSGTFGKIRQIVAAILEKEKEIELGTLVRMLREHEFKDMDYRKVRMYVVNALQVKDSPGRLVKKDGRVYIVK